MRILLFFFIIGYLMLLPIDQPDSLLNFVRFGDQSACVTIEMYDLYLTQIC